MSGREDVIESEGYAGDMNDGIITRSVNYLYNAIAEHARESRTTLSASYLEIYNEGEWYTEARHLDGSIQILCQ